TWLPQLGPYNEHFAKDVGAMFLAMAALAAVTFVLIANQTLVRVTALTWLVFNTLHCAYHLPMLHMYDARDAAINVIVLAVLVLAPAVLFVPVRVGRRPSAQSRPAVDSPMRYRS